MILCILKKKGCALLVNIFKGSAETWSLRFHSNFIKDVSKVRAVPHNNKTILDISTMYELKEYELSPSICHICRYKFCTRKFCAGTTCEA
jgi:hypothetical protein